MPSLRDIRKRITSVKNTGKITKAMQMVSAAKLRKVQNVLLMARPYSDRLYEMIAELSDGVEKENYPLLSIRPRKNVEVLVITSDKGLCGAYNTNVMKNAQSMLRELKNESVGVTLITMGKKAKEFFTRLGEPIKQSWVDVAALSYPDVQGIAGGIIDAYTEGKVDEFTVVYNEFKTVLVQSVRRLKLLPIEPVVVDGKKGGDKEMFLCEPSETAVLTRLLPKYVENQTYRTVLDSKVSEEAARMVAMENATNNTRDLITSLTLQYNKARQAAITLELMDIVGGAAAISEG
ncbi:MAG: ATP synthase F1 subunit gamma [Nitrospirae bacterium]|nr:ATP synthase F1 subunit gamma [Nitrospirota bacterium]